MKRRCDVVVFAKTDYDFNLDSVKEVLSKYNDDNKVTFVCLQCRYYLRGLSLGKQKTDMKKPSSETDYLCTCCHSIFKRKKQVVFFKKKNYDFENKCVQVALSEQVRCKNSIYEHICKNCHNQLKNTFPRIPENAHCRLENREKFCNGCTTGNSKGLQGGKKKQMNKNVGADLWLHIFETVGNTSSFDEAKSYMDKVKLPALDKKFKGLRQLIHDRLDSLAFHRVPNDVGVSKDNLFAVFTSGAGSCFYYTLSRLVYSNEDHVIEMRVRVLKEGFKNIDLYLDHNYLCRGYDFPYADDVSLPEIYATYCSFYDPAVILTKELVTEYYKREMFNLRRFSSESGIWQFHQAANVLGCPIQSVYPHVALSNLRNDFHRLILPSNLDCTGSTVRILWAMCSWNSTRFGHLVPLVEHDHSLHFIEENLCPVGYKEREPVFAEIDLTDGDNECREREHILHMDVDQKPVCSKPTQQETFLDQRIKDDGTEEVNEKSSYWEDVSGKMDPIEDRFCTFLCTSCHRNKKLRNDVIVFDVRKYNFKNDVIKNVLSEMYRCKDPNGMEYICKRCHDSLSHPKNPDIPRYSAFKRSQEKKDEEQEEVNGLYVCTCCYGVRGSKKRMVEFVEKNYNFGNVIVRKVFCKKYRCKCSDGSEFVCDTCHSYLISDDPKVPQKCAYNKELIGKIDTDKVKEKDEEDKKRRLIESAGQKFLENAKKIPDRVCTCCHHLLFEKSVKDLDIEKFPSNRVTARALNDAYRYKDKETGKEYICTTCKDNLKRGVMPFQAVANGLELPEIPVELQGLTRLECRCISLRIPFMQIRALPKGGRGKIRGPCVNVPATLQPITEVLPRIPENMDLVFLKFKRIITYKNNYMHDYIRPYKVMAALHWLKENNDHYKNVVIDTDWLKKFEHQEIFEHIIEEDEGRCVDIEENRNGQGKGRDGMDLGSNGVGEEENSRANISSEGDMVERMDVDGGEIITNDGKRHENMDDSESEKSDGEEDENLKEAQKDHDRRADITIGSTSTCVQFTDPDEIAFSIAPGQDAIPKFILMDKEFEVLAFPNLFPKGKGGKETDIPREREIDTRRYINQRLLNKDPRFSKNIEYIFAFQYATELKQLRTDMAFALKRQCTDGRKITAGDLKNYRKVNQMIWKDIAYKFMQNVLRNTSLLAEAII